MNIARYKALILIMVLIAPSLFAQEPEFQFKFRILHADFVEDDQSADSSMSDQGINLYYQVDGSFEMIRSESWIPSESATYVGSPRMGLFVKDATLESGYRRVISLEAKKWWKQVLIVVYADVAKNRYQGRPVVFSDKQRNTPGVHAFNLSGQAMQVTLGGDVQEVTPGKMVYFSFPESADNRYRIQAAVKKEERWRKIVSAKRYMDPDSAYFSIFCRPKMGKDRYAVRLVTVE